MKFAHLLEAFYSTPWHLRPESWNPYDAILQRALSGQDVSPVIPRAPRQFAAHFGGPARPIVGPLDENGQPMIEQMAVVGPLAIIPVHGVLGKKLSYLDLWCGGCDYAHVSEFVNQALVDPSIQAVVIDFASPGGQASGCGECAADIAALSAAKHTLGFTEDMCCSAAYWLASQCKELWATPTAMVGSIGTILAGVDCSQAWAKEGLKLELFTSSPLKATGMRGKPWTDEDRAYLTERVMQADAAIKSGVMTGRPQLKPEALDGRWFFAAYSVELGVVDAIARSLDAVLELALAED